MNRPTLPMRGREFLGPRPSDRPQTMRLSTSDYQGQRQREMLGKSDFDSKPARFGQDLERKFKDFDR